MPATAATAATPTSAAPAARIARVVAAPLGILILLPLIVAAAGLAVLLLGRRAAQGASADQTRAQLTAQAGDVARDVAFALDQAGPMLDRLRALADPALSIADVARRMHDLQVGRPGVTNVSIGFPSGRMRGTFVPPAAPGEIHAQESVWTPGGTTRTNYQLLPAGVRATDTRTTDYDVRTRPHYALAAQTRRRTWTPPRVYFTSKTTGLTCVEPVYAADGALQAVVTVDFDIGALSRFIASTTLEGARAVVFAGDGTILAFPSSPVPEVAAREARLVRHQDYADPVLAALFRHPRATRVEHLQFLMLDTAAGPFLAAVAPIAGRRAGVETPLDWHLAALIPEATLLGATHRLERQALLASGVALLIALGVAMMFAWNVVRMQRDVRAARATRRSAEAEARELGSYRLVARLGEGGMGEVWRAEHRLLARQAAIKLVRPEVLVDPLSRSKARERFRREAQTLASMQSRHTIRLYDYGVTDDGTFFYVMELLDGLDLDKLVRSHGPQPAARVIHLLVHACQSLAEAHAAGLLHRDIKPANIVTCRMADEIDVAKVLDFGIVQSLSEPTVDPVAAVSLPAPSGPLDATTKLTRDGAVIGTPGYISPEQIMGTSLDLRSDLYALGCVAWWLLVGAEVFHSTDAQGALRAHVQEAVPPLRPRVAGWLPDELEALVMRLLAKDPQDRPASAAALAEALRAIVIPPTQAWRGEPMDAWWRSHQPGALGLTLATRDQPVLVPGAPTLVATPAPRPPAAAATAVLTPRKG